MPADDGFEDVINERRDEEREEEATTGQTPMANNQQMAEREPIEEHIYQTPHAGPILMPVKTWTA